MREATKNEIAAFSKRYCKDTLSRISMNKYFEVKVESFEELLPGKTVNSYATGSRKIEGAFMIFDVYDREKELHYFPVFSESTARAMLKAWNKPVPKKRSIFTSEESSRIHKGSDKTASKSTINEENAQLRRLILFSRSLMVYHINNPQPMGGMLNEIYEKYDTNPSWKIKAFEVKSINTALKNFLKKNINTRNENFQTLQEYIDFLRHNKYEKCLKSTNFDILREIMKKYYPEEQIFF